ncbi:MAG: NADH-quinone oxidoreductase subunit NuoH [Bacilli bacterium]
MFSWQTQPLTGLNFIGMVIGAVVVLAILLLVVMYLIFFLRKVVAWMQNRIGPNRVGPWGLFQSMADVLKLLLKEDIVPANADRALFLVAPVIAFVPAFMVLAVIPYTAGHIFTAGLNIGVLYYVALSSITILGIVLGGWASNNKYSLVGGLRSAAQMISYEIPLGMSVLGVVMLAGSLNLTTIVQQQATDRFGWYIIPQIIGFVVFMIAAVAELNQTPFDLPEAESELVAGYFTEYTGFRFAFYMLTEFVYLFAISALATTLFLGGWLGPWLPSWLWFAIKTSAVIFFMFWVRASMPRLRVDKLMGFAWKVLIPVALFNILLTGLLSLLV